MEKNNLLESERTVRRVWKMPGASESGQAPRTIESNIYTCMEGNSSHGNRVIDRIDRLHPPTHPPIDSPYPPPTTRPHRTCLRCSASRSASRCRSRSLCSRSRSRCTAAAAATGLDCVGCAEDAQTQTHGRGKKNQVVQTNMFRIFYRRSVKSMAEIRSEFLLLWCDLKNEFI